MKRKGNLFSQIYDIDNLRLAYIKAKRCRESKPDIYEYSKNADKKLNDLSLQLKKGTVNIGNYHYFTIYDPKERVICAASFPERVLHHAIMNVCHPVFESFQIYDSYATRIGKGQYAALERAKQNNKQYSWFCKMDVRKYFDSINHEILLQKLQYKFKDQELLNLFRKIIASYEVQPGRGVPIGNLTSQYFANFYLGFADHFIKEKLQVQAYVRYMDDMVIWSNNKTELIHKSNQFISFLQQELQLAVKPVCLHKVAKGLPFLGYVCFRNALTLNKLSKKRFIYKLETYKNKYDSEIWTQKQYSLHVTPLIAFTQYANTVNLRRKLFCTLETG